MKPIKKISILLAVGLFSFACVDKDFLELTPQQSVADTEFLLTLADMQSAMTGCYDQLQLADWYGRYMLLVPDIMGEDVKQNASANRAKEWAEYNGSTSTTHNVNREFWAEMYEGINMANQIINSPYEPTAAIQAEFNQLRGEAFAMRALAYFDLVRLFGQHYTFTAGASHPGVPIVLTFDVESEPSRDPVSAVYDQVIGDFLEAIGLMTAAEAPSNAGRFSKEAAQALLSRVYLYMEDYTKAEAMATAVIASANYSLVDSASYPDQFLPGLSSEAIFEMIYSTDDGLSSNHVGGMYKTTGYGDYLPSQGFLALMDPADVRSTMFLVDDNLGGAYASTRVNKYPSTDADNGTDNTPIIRLSEVYLIRAEANAELGNDGLAQADVDMIRERAWPTGFTAVTETGAALLTAIGRGAFAVIITLSVTLNVRRCS